MTAEVLARENESNMAASPWLWEEDGSIAIKSQPVSITYCTTLNCVLLTTTDNHVDIIDVNSGDIIRRELLLSDEKNVNSQLQCVFNASVGSLVITNGTKVGLRKDINGIYLLHTILQAPLHEIRDEEIIVEMTLSDMEHIVSGLQAAIKNAHEPQLSMMERVLKKVKDSIQKMQTKITDEEGKLQKWATCCVNIDGETIHSALTHSISNLQTIAVKGPQLSSTSALLSQISNLLPNYVGDQPDVLTTKKKMWSEANRRKTFNNWPHKHYKWAVPETMAQAGFYHQSDRRTYPNSVDRAVCFTCNVGLVCWEPTDEPWSEHERHSPSCPFVRGECTENVPLSVTVATSPAQCHNDEKEKIACLSVPSSVALMSTSTLTGHVVVWDIQDELQVRCRLQLVVDDEVLANNFEEMSDLLALHIDNSPVDESTKEIIDEVAEIFLEGFQEGTSSKKPSINNKPSRSSHAIAVQGLGLLKNNQEVDSDEDSNSVQPLLSEAMLLAGMTVTTKQQAEICKHLCLVVCEIPADKHKQRPSGIKVIDEKSKSKPVSYSTQLSFESEDEFYDPLFAGSMPHDVFPKITSPTKDTFAKIWGNKSEESTIKDGKIIQCLNLDQYLEHKGGQLCVRQILPYHNGCYVLLVVASIKESVHKSCATTSDSPTQMHNDETNGDFEQIWSNFCDKFSTNKTDVSCEVQENAVKQQVVNRYLMLYKTCKIKGRTLLEEKPIKIVSFDDQTTIHSLILLPDDVEESFNATTDNVTKPDYLAAITAQGSIVVLDGLNLDMVTSYMAADKVYSHVVFCSGLSSFCASTTDNNLDFLHLIKNANEKWERSANVNHTQVSSNEKQIKDQPNDLSSDNLTLPMLKSLVEMTKFENLVPRYTAIVPVFWAEIQQEQQQRRHPQHLLQNAQGDASCHTRTWRLQKKGLVGGDQLFELMLPRPCYVGHVDVKFTMNKSIKSKNRVQVILSKPRSTTLRAKPTQSVSAQHMKGDLICGPVDLCEDLKPYGEHGHVVLTSPVLLRNKVRTLYVVFKCKPKASGQDEKNPGGGRTGFSGLEEISITVRSLSLQYNAEVFDRYFDVVEFSSQLLDIACRTSAMDVSGKDSEDLQWYALELMCWIAGITVHQPVSEGCLSSLLVECLPQLIQSCFLTASRSIAHKCSRLVVLCVSQLAPNDDSIEPCLLRALLNVLPLTLSCDSVGGLHWFFTLLTGLVSSATLDLTGASCVELLIEIGHHLDDKLTDFDRILRANFSLYGTPLDPMVFDVSNETLGLFASRSLSGDLLNPKTNSKTAIATTDVDEVDLMDYTLSKNNENSAAKMEKLLSCASGILEVEPLAYVCSSMSDGCKVDQGLPLLPAHPVPPQHGMYAASPHPVIGQDGLLHGPMATLQDHVHQLKEHEKLLSKLQKQKMQLEEQHQELEELGGMFFSNHLDKLNDDPWFAGKKLPSPKFGATASSLAAGSATGVKSYPSFGVKQPTPTLRGVAQQRVSTKTKISFQLPVPKVLVIEKLQTGSRHFVVLDFGQNVRLTDIFIPACPDLSSLVIDIWMDSEEKDLNRVTVSTDIGTKCLLLTDLLPPITCRYLKISLFALRGTLRTKLILGEYFGYPVPSEEEANDSEDMQRIHYLTLVYDDVFCQYGIACQRLESLLNCLDPAILNASNPSGNTKLLPGETNVRQAYTSCMNLQLRLNFLEHSIQRLEGLKVKEFEPPSTSDDIDALIAHASYSKLKSISDWLVHVLVSLFGIDEPTDEQGQQWYGTMTLEMCQDLFTTFCVKGTCSSRAKVGALLLRMCGERTWWGGFLAWVMQHFFSCNQSMVFSRERLFLLLSSMSQLSSLQFTVITSGLTLLQSLLVPLSDTNGTASEPFDSGLLEWVTLYVCNLLDNFIDTTQDFTEKVKDGQTCSQNDDKNTNACKMPRANLTKRWDFIAPKEEDGSNDNSKDSKKEMQKIMKQIAIRQKRLQVLHQQHMLNKAYHAESYNSSPSSWSPPSPSQITHWNKQFRLKAKKPLKDLKRLKRMMANNSNQTTSGNTTPRQTQKLPRDLCLPVMKGLMTVLLSRQGACNVDFFVLICKVLSCLKIVSYPAVVLSDVTTREQLDQLLRMCVKQQGVVHNNWSMGDHWIRHAATCLLQDLLTDMRISTVQTHNTTKLQEAEISDNNDTSDISCMNDNSDAASDNDVLNESTDLASMETGTEASIPEETGVDPLEGYVDIFPEVTPPDNNAYGCPIITIKDPTATTTKTPVISTSSSISELSTAEDCRLEISVEMKAERELRRLAFVSRQRFLAGMDLKTGGKLPDVETRDLFEDNERMNPDVSHVFSQCIGQLVVDAFRDFYDIDSVLELCLLLNNNNTCCSFFITMDSMNSFLQGYSTMDGMSPRSCNLAISWLRCMLRQITSPEHEHPYPTAKTLVEDPRVVRVIGNILMTYNYGNSGKKALGPSVVENFSSLLKSLMALQEQGVAVHTLQDLFLGILLIVTKHKDDGKTTIPLTNRPLDMCVEFLEFFTRHFPTSPHANSLAKYAMVFDSILSLVLAHLSSTNQVLCIGNSSKRRYTLAGDTSVTSRDPGVEVTANQFTVLCLKILGKLLSIDRGEKTEQSMFDYVLNDKASMKRLMCCLNMCRGESFGLIEIGLNILSSDLGTIDGLANPTSIEDGVLKTFCLLYKHCSTKNLVISAILDYFISDRADDQSGMDSAHAQLSELLLWVLLKLLDSDEMFRNFYENGGIEVICRKLCQASSRALHPMRGIVSTVVHQLGVKNVKNDGDKSLLATAWLSDKQLVNFAPFATINCVQENGNPPDPLISSSAPHRRARTALWSYHFKNNETWFSLDITLPNCIIVHEVLVQPHSTSLVMSTSYVTLELSHAGSTVSKISPPLLSAALGNIRLQLTTPELASVVRVRFHRPRDSDTLGLTRIEVLGTSFYGPVPQVQALLQSQKMSLNWSRALDYCIRRSHDLSRAVLETLSGITGILDVLLKILWSFPSSNLKTCIESTLVKLASHSSQHCTRLLTQLLYGGRLTKDGDGCLVGSLGVASDNSENELLYQLGILKDEQSWDRLRIICEWLLHVEKETKEQGKMVSNNVVSKLRTVAAIIWIINDDPSLCERLQSLITEEKFRCLYEWCQNCTRIPKLKLTLDYLICALCYVIPAYYVVPLSNVTVNTVVLDFSSLTSLAHASLSSRGAKLLLESSVLQDVISEVEKLCTKSSKGSKKVAKETDTVSTDFDKIRGTVEFLTLCLGQPVLKQWLGGDQGNYFWRSLLLFLMECHPRAYHARSTRASVCPRLLADLQTSVMNFFKKCVSGHPTNQRHLARVLHELFALVTNDDTRTLTGFLRRLILELLLDGDHVVLAVTCSGEISHCMMTALGNSSQSPLWHPRFGASNSCRLVRVRLNTTVQELTSLLVANPLRQLPKVTATNGSARKMSETLQDLMELLEISDISKPEAISLTTSAINVKHKRGGSHGNRENGESSGKETKVQDSVGLEMTYLICEDGPLAGIPLAKETTVAQIMECLLQHGQHLASVCIKLRVKSNVEQAAQVDVASNVVSKPVSNLLEVFSSLGGLALIANNLPPHFSVTMGDGSTRVLATTPSYMPAVLTSSVPGHSLMGFTMFLRLPGYANVLLEDQKSARIMLRLILGLEEDDAEQGSTLLQSLPTLPFNILDKILKLDAITTTTGVALRQTALDIGVVHLLLTTLGLLSHHEPRGRDMKHEATVEALKVYNTSDDIRRSQATGCTNSKQYWAKGTGFGTGSTSSGWDIEQALVKQKSEEEHITWILQVLASFVCPLGVVINPDSNIDEIALSVPDEDITNILPTLPEILMNSCLIPTLASYLRNDSVLDMARHVPLYRALLSLVRCMAVSPNLVPLLHPPRSQTATTTNGDSSSLCSLLTKMKLCVDTYGSRLKCSEKSKETKADKTDPPVSSTPTGTKQDEIENESLSLFIPDVQTTSMLVHKAVDHYRWDHLQNEGSQSEIDGQGTEAGKNMSTEERYSSVMMSLQFDTFHIVTEGADGKPSFSIPYHYSSSVKSATSSGQRTNAGRARRLAQEIASLSTSLPLSYNSSVFVRCDEERLDLMKVLITGPAETPYANGCFEFDVYFPPDYPSNPMHISFETTGNHRIRFNPNLYNDGKVCLSILNTWHGRPEEKWNSQTSSFLQVLVSIQSLILVPEPYFNEPGYERSRGTHSGTVNSREYDANIRQATVKWAMLEPLKKPCRCFKEVIERHFYLKKDEVLKQCDDWIRELEMWSKEKRTMRSITHHLESLRRHTTQLRDVISKLSDSCLETRDDDEDTDDKGDNEGGNGDAQGSKGNGEDDQGFKGHNQEYNGDNGTNAANEDSVKDGEKLGGDTY